MAGLLWGAFFLIPGAPALSQPESLNSQTDNLNVLFLGFEDEELAMVAVYSINHRDRFQSAAVFFPPQGQVPGQGMDFRRYYREAGLLRLRQAVEECLRVPIAYQVTIKNSIMDEVEQITGPILVNGKRVDLKGIFTMAPGPQDEEILGELVRRLTKAEVYFWHLPRLFLKARYYISTDFPLTWDNLRLHYRIASNLNPRELRKFILSLEPQFTPGTGITWHFQEEQLSRVLYDLTA
ncbi:MAG TPA: hypothetical protein GXX34_06005 [Clostridia bacterium]|nr:hypothetical protein [Clostridia bacterium]